MYANVYIFMQQQSIKCKVVLHLACTCLNKSYVNMYATFSARTVNTVSDTFVIYCSYVPEFIIACAVHCDVE